MQLSAPFFFVAIEAHRAPFKPAVHAFPNLLSLVQYLVEVERGAR